MAPLAPPANASPADIAVETVEKPDGQMKSADQDAEFVARVLATMNGTRTRLPLSGGGSGGKNYNTTNSSGSGSGSSLNSLRSNASSFTETQKPPKPPTSQARKQLRLLPKQREQSPVLSNGYTLNTSKRLTSTLNNTRSSSATCNDTNNTERLRMTTRSPSPAYSVSSRCSTLSSVTSASSRFSRLQTPPRRVFPQSYAPGNSTDAYEMRNLESSPVVFDANLSFVLGCKKQPVHQSLRASPSFEDPRTASAHLSEKIQNFLNRTDHVQEEWKAMGRRSRQKNSSGLDSGRTTPTNSLYDDYDTISLIERQRQRASMERCGSVGRSRSTQNILTKAFQLSKQLPRMSTSRSNSLAREFSNATTADNDDDDDRTIHEDDNELDEVGLALGS